MISNFSGRTLTALFSVAFLFASLQLGAQKTVPLSPSVKTQLLGSGEAETYRSHLISKLGGKLEATAGSSERTTISLSGQTIVCDVASQFISVKNNRIEQITIKITENGGSTQLNLVQYANGEVGVLEGGNLVTYSLKANAQSCLNSLFGAGTSCTNCKNKISSCLSNDRVVKILTCLYNTYDGSCISCGIAMTGILNCILFTRS